jgi:uncharacterized phage protein (TIGR02218 family)
VTWESDETSVAGSRPIELYTFSSPTRTWRLTSFRRDVTVGGQTYVATPTSRSSVGSQDATASSDDFTVEIPAEHEIAAYYSDGIPPRALLVVAERFQVTSGISLRIADGYAAGPVYRKGMASFRVSPAADFLQGMVPGVSASRICQHVLYDARCTIPRASFDVATTIVSIATNRRSVVVATVGGNPDDWARFGEIVFDATTERRTVSSQVGTTIGFRFQLPNEVDPGDTVTLFAGCDHTAATCAAKFANIRNFGGMPRLPRANPFWTDVRLVDSD